MAIRLHITNNGQLVSVDDLTAEQLGQLSFVCREMLKEIAETLADEAENVGLKCAFCEATVQTVDDAVAAGWIPSYYEGESECDGPVCPKCQEEKLYQAEDGEMVLKPTPD